MLVLPTRKVGAAPSGSANDALISIALSLTVGSRWRRAPAFQVEEAGGLAAWASSSPGRVAKRAAPPVPERKSRQFMVIPLGTLMSHSNRSTPEKAARAVYITNMLGRADHGFVDSNAIALNAAISGSILAVPKARWALMMALLLGPTSGACHNQPFRRGRTRRCFVQKGPSL